MGKKDVKMEIVNAQCAGIDVGSRSHYVAVGQGTEDVREFGVYQEDLNSLVKWLEENEIKSVAMESTGTYWQNLYTTIQSAGIEVLLSNGKFTKNIKGKKTDVKDCQWIQKLHSMGLLSGSFLPSLEVEEIRTYCRHRTNLVEQAASTTQRMQKYLRLLNLRLDVVVNDICGLTGIRIIEAVCSGEKDPKKLASLRNGNCKKSEEEIAKGLQSNGRKDYLFALQQEYDTYKGLQLKIELCDKEIEQVLKAAIAKDDAKQEHMIEKKIHKRVNKNAPKGMDLNLMSYQYFKGTDLLSIEGVSYSTVLTLISEVGDGLYKFKSAKEFASWLRLAPNNKISGGKLLSSKTPNGSNRLKIALRNAANVIGNLKDTTLSNFFARKAYQKGRHVAISATARKLAVIIWNMIVKGDPYKPEKPHEYLDQKRKKITAMKRQMAKMGITIEELETPIQSAS